MTTGIVDRIAWEPWWRLSMGAGVLDDAGVEVSRGPAGGRSTPVDHAAWPPGSRVPLRTPIREDAVDLCGEHRADARVQLGAPRSSAGVRAFAASQLDRAQNLAQAARSRSQSVSNFEPWDLRLTVEKSSIVKWLFRPVERDLADEKPHRLLFLLG